MKLFGFLFRLVLVVGLVVWLADRPGSAHIVWHDMVFETSAAVLALMIAAFAYGLVLLHRLWRFIIDGPRVWGLNRKIGKLEDGQTELAKGFAALAGQNNLSSDDNRCGHGSAGLSRTYHDGFTFRQSGRGDTSMPFA